MIDCTLVSFLWFSEPNNDGQKRRRLDGAGQENCSPKLSSSQRLAELGIKPDTPIVPSVRSRLEQLSQRREGGQTCHAAAGALIQCLLKPLPLEKKVFIKVC